MKYNQEFKARLNKAFAQIRKTGLMAKQNYQCCSGCAGSMIAGQVKQWSPDRRALIKGFVYYHQQDGEIFTMRSSGSRYVPVLHVRYGNIEVDEVLYGIGGDVIGRVIADEMGKVGLEVKWDGDPSKTIEVGMPGAFGNVSASGA